MHAFLKQKSSVVQTRLNPEADKDPTENEVAEWFCNMCQDMLHGVVCFSYTCVASLALRTGQ